MFQSAIERLLLPADVVIDGDRPWDIRVHDPRVYRRGLFRGSVGLGESYVDGWWSTSDLEGLMYRLALARLDRRGPIIPRSLTLWLKSLLFNRQSPRGALGVVHRHYDFDNDLFSAFLGKYKNYSCGFFDGTDDLDEAQRLKLDLICRKLELRPGQHLLDVGGGWGELARYAASQYGVRVTSINLSEEQMRFARERCRGLDVEIVRSDYRDVRGRFDKVAAIAMFTHVGYKNYRTFMRSMHRVLAPGGSLLLEGVWGNVSVRHIDPWMDKYIFPAAMIPSGAQTFRAFEDLFVAEDLHNFGPSYVQTLRAWNANLHRAWPELGHKHDDRTRRILEYFFLMIAGFFRARSLSNWHLVLTKPGRSLAAARLTLASAASQK